MVIFHSYVSLPEGIIIYSSYWSHWLNLNGGSLWLWINQWEQQHIELLPLCTNLRNRAAIFLRTGAFVISWTIVCFWLVWLIYPHHKSSQCSKQTWPVNRLYQTIKNYKNCLFFVKLYKQNLNTGLLFTSLHLKLYPVIPVFAPFTAPSGRCHMVSMAFSTKAKRGCAACAAHVLGNSQSCFFIVGLYF